MTSRSWLRTASIPSPSSQVTAAPSPTPSTIGEVPASNFAGTPANVISSNVTRLIMWPPPMNGGIASRISRLPCRIPMPVGP